MAQAPRLLLVTPPVADPPRLRAVLPDLLGIVDAVLLRWPDASARQILSLARDLVDLPQRPVLLISDRVDLALAAGVEGVHLRDGGLPAERVRSWGPSLVGSSCHPATSAVVPAGADYVTASPVFATSSKPKASPLGEEGLARFCASSPAPVLALGGVDASRVPSCRRAGAYGVAVLSAVWSAPDPIQAACSLRAALDAA